MITHVRSSIYAGTFVSGEARELHVTSGQHLHRGSHSVRTSRIGPVETQRMRMLV